MVATTVLMIVLWSGLIFLIIIRRTIFVWCILSITCRSILFGTVGSSLWSAIGLFLLVTVVVVIIIIIHNVVGLLLVLFCLRSGWL